MDDDLRNKIQAALKEAGAFCGECGWQPGEDGCTDCKRHWNWCTDALLPVFQAERKMVRVEALTEAEVKLHDHARELSTEAEEEMRRDLEETAQEWRAAAEVVAKVRRQALGQVTP